jgi:hypothetical protein
MRAKKGCPTIALAASMRAPFPAERTGVTKTTMLVATRIRGSINKKEVRLAGHFVTDRFSLNSPIRIVNTL